ncbi:hypothetical protein MFIFM68171_01731 [Madurella fahalii]|uniref:Aminoglycoside phosphotransferase domain-containing protein n=1 Tax=Madurella fahalii TaxID=1157608 RepID=A0ABQ0G186_9PEZI
MEFDFQAYLSSLYPSTAYHITFLTGGLVNFTVRARRADAGSFPSPPSPNSLPPSLILKHAPPYIATLGASAPFSQARQTVEATVLELFHNPTNSQQQQQQRHETPLAFVTHGSNPEADEAVRIPRLIAHDATSNILMLEDLGDDLVTLWDLFTDPAATAQNSAPARPLRDRCATMGVRLGRFFRHLHSAAAFTRAAASLSEQGRAALDSALTRDVVRDAAVRPLLARLRQWAGLGKEEDGEDGERAAQRLYARVEADFERGDRGEAYDGEACLSMGDFHPGSVLVSPGPAAAGGRETVAVIDWEFATARNGRGVNGDMAQFLAHLHVLMLSLPRGGAARKAVEEFVREMCRAYAGQEGSGGGDVVVVVPRQGLYERERSALGILRSALILFGRETINQAVERTWEGAAIPVETMVKAGVWYLERAGDTIEEMVEERNWEELMNEKSEIMVRLFGLKG